MVDLIGVHHGGKISSFFSTQELLAIPSHAFMGSLLRYPRGTKIGIESLSDKDFEEVREHLRELSSRRLTKEHERWPSYERSSNSYWKHISNECKRLGHTIVYLEDKDDWFKYNKASVVEAKQISKIDVLSPEDGESELENYRKLLQLNERIFLAFIKKRKIHEIDRDNTLLERIKSEYVDVAITGLGHSDYWISNRERLLETLGIQFGSYSTDLLENHGPYGSPFYEMSFTQNAFPNPSMVFERESLERAIRFLKTGRITEKRDPDYVGVFDTSEPSKGYFELFMDEDTGGRFTGTIDDLLGTAKIEGSFLNDMVVFTKQYGNSRETAIRDEILYRGQHIDDQWYGYYFVKGSAGPFVMSRYNGQKPIDLSLNFERQWDRDRDQIKQVVPDGYRF